MKPIFFSGLLTLGLALAPGLAQAHISIVSGTALSNTTQEISFGVGHGCEGSDTTKVEIEIPAGVTSVRPSLNAFGQADVETNAAGAVVAVSWTKSESAVLPADTQYYKLTVRMKVPDQPFNVIYFPAKQTCTSADGKVTVVDWASTDQNEVEGGPEPAPALYVVPPHFPGWNKLTVAREITDLSLFFSDAQIVWRGSSAYSKNPTTTELIGTTDGVSSLGALVVGDEIWVRY